MTNEGRTGLAIGTLVFHAADAARDAGDLDDRARGRGPGIVGKTISRAVQPMCVRSP